MTANDVADALGRARAVAPNGYAARLLVAILTTAGLFYVDFMPALVIGLQAGLGFTPQAAGYVVAANVYGAAAGGLVAVFTVNLVPWRAAAMVALLLLIGADALSTQVSTPGAMIALRLVDGLIGGVLVGTGYSIIARMQTPERTFGMLLVVQFGLGGLGVFWLPRLVERFGASVLFLALIAFSVLALIALPLIPRHAPHAATLRTNAAAQVRDPHYGALLAALAAVFLFQASSMGIMAFMFNIGRSQGLRTEFISTQAGLAHIVAIAGGLLVLSVGVKWGRARLIILGLIAAIAARAFFLEGTAFTFAVAATGAAVTHAFVLPYLLGLCASFDLKGRITTLGGFISKLGLASGPAVGALLIGGNGYDRLVLVALAGLVGAGVAAMLALAALRGRQAIYEEELDHRC